MLMFRIGHRAERIGSKNQLRAGKSHFLVTPAKAGVQKKFKKLDSCFRRNDIFGYQRVFDL